MSTRHGGMVGEMIAGFYCPDCGSEVKSHGYWWGCTKKGATGGLGADGRQTRRE